MKKQNDHRSPQPTSKTISLSLAFVVALSLAMTLLQVNEAAGLNTTINIRDKNGMITPSKVVVFNAANGRQIANGLTETGQFTFHSPAKQSLIVTVHTFTGYVGTAHLTPGVGAVVVADQEASQVKTALIECSSATLTYLDESGAPESDAQIAVVEWGSFEGVTRGTTDDQGQFTYRIRRNHYEADFLATVWDQDGSISLIAAVHPKGSSSAPTPDAPMGGIWLEAEFPTFGRLH